MTDWQQDVNEHANGIKGDTPLKEIVPDLVNQVPIDAFHVLYLGMCKRLTKQMLHVKKAAPAAKMKPVKSQIDEELVSTFRLRYPTEFLRRPRAINVPKYKSAEWRHLATAAFPIVSGALEDHKHGQYTKIWGTFVFLTRAMELPDDQFNELVQRFDIDKAMTDFYERYTRVFGLKNCAPNVHMYYHILHARKKLSLNRMTTEPYESFYAILKKSYHPGTKSMGKQMLMQVYTSYLGRGRDHVCTPRVQIRPLGKSRCNDSIIVTHDGFYEIKDRSPNGHYLCKKYTTRIYKHPGVPHLPFHLVKTFRSIGQKDELVEVDAADIIGKAVKCMNILSYIPFDTLYG